MLTDKSVGDLLADFASSAPTPGGGSASALASALGAALLTMVTALPKTRSGSDDDRQALAAAAVPLSALQRQLTDAIDLDSAAYDRVVAAYRLPKATEAERMLRTAAIADALRGATDVPLDVVRLSSQALDRACVVAAHGHRGASSDIGVALALLGAGLHGARLNVEINLEGLSDRGYADATRAEVSRLSDAASRAALAAEASLRSGIV